jgi:4-amino-4-deoxy-L-arabinose transferase-like glycosyltransferase
MAVLEPLATPPARADRFLVDPRLLEGLRPVIERLLVVLSVATGAITHGVNLFNYPLYVTDEGIYIQQAWSVLREARLSPYTYFYDHAPAGWLVIAGWVALLPGQFQTFSNAVDTGRALMLLVHMISTFLLYRVTAQLTGGNAAAVVAAFLFNVSPLAIFYQRQVLLDNLMVMWILLALYLVTGGGDWRNGDLRIVAAMVSGLAFGAAVLTKENAVFFAPVVAYLLLKRLRRRMNYRFSMVFWSFSLVSIVSLYFLYATLKNELFPSGLSFDLNNPPADHVSLLYTIWWQMHRSEGSILDTSSPVWRFSLGAWLPRDRFILGAGAAATLINLAIGLLSRGRRREAVVISSLALSYGIYLARGSQMLEFYVVPLLPFLAMNIALIAGWLVSRLPGVVQAVPVMALIGVFSLNSAWGYVMVVDQFGHVVPHDLYKLNQTDMQAQQLEWIRQNIPPDAKLIIDDDMWADLHDEKPYYKWAHSHYKASSDPDVRDKLFGKDWRNIDYIVMSNKMRDAMVLNNGDGGESWILQALDHSQPVWSVEHGDVKLEIDRVNKQ